MSASATRSMPRALSTSITRLVTERAVTQSRTVTQGAVATVLFLLLAATFNLSPAVSFPSQLHHLSADFTTI